ncbi:hypothetical protein A9Q98_08875 [Thalassotalea sp. 42_200_T64]|nr:hypothetical protein A9Q98_08875 [Thalassotalea sp. 42_200_T64]
MRLSIILLTLLSFISHSDEFQLSIKEHTRLSNNSAINAKYWLATNQVSSESSAPLLIYLHGRGGVD